MTKDSQPGLSGEYRLVSEDFAFFDDNSQWVTALRRRDMSPLSLKCAEELQAVAKEGAQQDVAGNSEEVNRIRRKVQDLRKDLEDHLRKEDKYKEDLQTIQTMQRIHYIFQYTDYMSQTLHQLRARVKNSINHGGKEFEILKNGRHGDKFRSAPWTEIMDLLDKEEEQLQKWCRDGCKRGQSPDTPIKSYLRDIAHLCCEFDLSMLVRIIREYANRNEHAHSGYQHLVRRGEWYQLIAMFRDDEEKLETRLRGDEDAELRAALSQCIKHTQAYYFEDFWYDEEEEMWMGIPTPKAQEAFLRGKGRLHKKARRNDME